MLRSPLRLAALSIALLLCTSPTHGQQPAGRPRSNANNTLTDAERAAGWRLLFDGSTTNGWRGYKSQTLPPAWHVEDGTLTKNTGTDDIITTDWRLLSRHGGIRPHLLERARVSAARRQGARRWEEPQNRRRGGLCYLPVARRPSPRGRRMEPHAYRREREPC